jgi:ribonuclease HI
VIYQLCLAGNLQASREARISFPSLALYNDLARELYTTGYKVTIYWVLGYKEVPGNKETDKAAKKTIRRSYIGKYLGILLIYI